MKIKVKHCFVLEEEVPDNWTKEDILFWLNSGTWCSTNALTDLIKKIDADGCFCHNYTGEEA
jgi:hypothetical protein